MAMELHSRPVGSASSPPPPPPSSPAPPLPPRVKVPNVPPPPPPAGGEGGGEEDEDEGEVFFPMTGNRKSTPPPPIAARHKRSCSESDYGLPTSPRIYSSPDSSFKKYVPASPLSSLAERPDRGFRRADSDGSSSHFQHHPSQAPPNGSPTNQRSQSFESDRRGPAPQPLPRRSLPRGSTSRRVEALYDCQADHHDELSFSEGQVLVVLGQEDSDWWHGYIEDEPERRGLFPSSFVQLLLD